MTRAEAIDPESAAPFEATEESKFHEREAWIRAREPGNLLALVGHQVVMRSGWIFKTETVIIPAFLDAIAGAGWLRGCLPVLNRLGQSVPPLLFARRLAAMKHKKWALVASSLAMGLPMLVLAGLWWSTGAAPPFWMPGLFLVLYTVFGACNGINQLSFGTVQGKLIQPSRRGRLLAMGAVCGASAAILLAWWLLGSWLELPGQGFERIFAFAGVSFLVGGLMAIVVREPADERTAVEEETLAGAFVDAWRTVRDDPAFRRLAVVTTLFSTILILFPHFQAFARERMHLAGGNMMVWVIVQNAMLGAYSLLVGPLADRRGNRLALRLVIFSLGVTPLLAVVLAHLDPELGRRSYWLVFALLGLTPVTMKSLHNYALEIAPPAEHPRYLSTLGISLAVPFLCSPLVGWLIDRIGFETVFLVGSGLVLTAGLMTFRLPEPRYE